MEILRGLDPKQKWATTALAAVALFFMGYIGSSYLQRPQNVEIVPLSPQNIEARGQVIADNAVVVEKEATVHVVGAVARPDVYTLPAGSNINDAIKAAGGALKGADLESINLAEKLIDGTQIRVLLKGEKPIENVVTEVAQSRSTISTTSPKSNGLVSINSATLEELDTLPGIGPAKARAIIDYRTKIGGFKSIEELNAVKGIGDKTMADLRPLIKL